MRRLISLLAVACASGAACAQSGLPADEAALKEFLSRQVAAAAPQLSRFDIQLLQPAARADLAPCGRTEFFLPAGARAWGRVSVGVRCVQGAGWTVMLPAVVRAWSPGLVAQVPLAAGVAPGPQDVAEQEVELTREPGPVVRDAAALQGRVLARSVGAGQPLRADMLRAPQVVQAGDPVHLRIAGTGFAISATGQALVAAAEGQPVRVRTEFGKVLSGVARQGRYVDVTP
ncbi:flagellar basal body P-ring formation chaperone FlgA [Ramlibacter sp. MMS24-I3-19]|uniref:flagellar basal body P-ring formation chaperone FlgA n=1 Tax=Ramlibacter sp. MMS24-I3-19 TaxID=3416606 RepID=UPI003D0201E0